MECDCERTFANGKAGFAEFLEALETDCRHRGLPPEVTSKVMIALDEVISNILNHGAKHAVPRVTVRLAVRNGQLRVEVSDDGIPFNPLTLPEPDTSLSVEDRAVGGLGIHIVRKLMDHVEYAHDGTFNRLRFSKTCSI